MSKVIRQIGYNFLLIFISAFVIYLTECFRHKDWNVFAQCINAEFLFVMITSLLTVVFWRALENINAKGILNFVGLLVAGICFFIYGIAIVITEDYIHGIVVIGFCVICVSYIIENVIVIHHYATHGQKPDSQDNLVHDNDH